MNWRALNPYVTRTAPAQQIGWPELAERLR